MTHKRNTDTKVLSVRLSTQEAVTVDEDARAAGLKRNDYIRLRLLTRELFEDVRKLDDLISALRQIERTYDRYLTTLEGILSSCDGSVSASSIKRIEEEIDRADALMELSFKAQQQAVKILKRLRRSVT